MKTDDETAEFLKVLADGTRLQIISLLREGELCACEIIPATKRAQPTVSLQLAKLERAGIVTKRKSGRKVFYKLSSKRAARTVDAARRTP